MAEQLLLLVEKNWWKRLTSGSFLIGAERDEMQSKRAWEILLVALFDYALLRGPGL